MMRFVRVFWTSWSVHGIQREQWYGSTRSERVGLNILHSQSDIGIKIGSRIKQECRFFPGCEFLSPGFYLLPRDLTETMQIPHARLYAPSMERLIAHNHLKHNG